MTMKHKHKGAVAELKVSAWLLNKGFEVFRNISQHGLADIVAWNPLTGERVLYDVKTIHHHVNVKGKTIYYPPKLKEEQIEAGVNLLIYNPDTDEITETILEGV